MTEPVHQGYDGQITVDGKHQIILAQRLTQNASDQDGLLSLIDASFGMTTISTSTRPCIMVPRNCGSKGYPGTAEVDNMQLPQKLLRHRSTAASFPPCSTNGAHSTSRVGSVSWTS